MMDPQPPQSELTVELGDDHVATVEFSRPPSNYFSVSLIQQIVTACQELAADDRCRAVVLCSTGRVFCAWRRPDQLERCR